MNSDLYETMSIGSVISELEKCDPSDQVRFDFGYMCPTCCDSYRGYYDHLAIGYQEGTWPSVHSVLSDLKSAIGKTFEGYKGGDYKMEISTPLWVANYGDSTGTTIVGISRLNGMAVILTGYAE